MHSLPKCLKASSAQSTKWRMFLASVQPPRSSNHWGCTNQCNVTFGSRPCLHAAPLLFRVQVLALGHACMQHNICCLTSMFMAAQQVDLLCHCASLEAVVCVHIGKPSAASVQLSKYAQELWTRNRVSTGSESGVSDHAGEAMLFTEAVRRIQQPQCLSACS